MRLVNNWAISSKEACRSEFVRGSIDRKKLLTTTESLCLTRVL